MLKETLTRPFKRSEKIVLVLCAILLILLADSYANSIRTCNRKIRTTRLYLELYRHKVETYKEAIGQYPETLAAMHEFAKEHPDIEIYGKSKEYITSGKGVWSESANLDGSGGWYYNPQTGEIKINLTHPIKKYTFLYFGSYRNEIPAEW